MGYDPNEPRNRIGEWTDGGAATPLDGPHVIKQPMATPASSETAGQRALRLASEATMRGEVPPNVVGEDARRLYQQVMARSQAEHPDRLFLKGQVPFKEPATPPSPLAWTGATDAMKHVPMDDPIRREYAAIGLRFPEPEKDGGSRAMVVAPPRVSNLGGHRGESGIRKVGRG